MKDSEGGRLEYVACNLCGSSRSKVRFQSADGWPDGGSEDYVATTDKFGVYGTILQCRDCGLVYTSPRLQADHLIRAYETVKDDEYFVETESRSINAYMILPVVRRYVARGRLLDVGCGAGFLLNAARVYYEVTGVEPSRWGRQYAEEQLGLQVVAGTLHEARFPGDHFDVVTLVDVIEHVPDPAGLVREIRRVTRPGGIVCVVTPDIGSLSARVLRGKWWGLRPAHIYYFSRPTLTRLLENSGYSVVEIRSYGRVFTWRYWLTRLSNYPRVVRRAAGLLMRLAGREDKFLYIDTRDSIQVVAQKRG